MTDYTRQHANKLRAVTIAGELANIIRQIQQNAPLFVVPASTFTSGSGGGTGGTCGLTFNPTSVSLTIPTNDTGSVAATVTVTSAIAQTVTFCAYWPGGSPNPCTTGTAPDACIGNPSVFPSTVTFTAGQSATIMVTIPYTNCTTVGLTGTISLGAVTDTGCAVNNALISGTVTTSNAPTFVLEVQCYEIFGDSCYCTGGTSYGTTASAAEYAIGGSACNTVGLSGTCPGSGCFAYSGFRLRARSVNGFAGTLTLSQSQPCVYGGCSALDGSIVTLTAGQTVVITGALCATVTIFSGANVATRATWNGFVIITATSGGISRAITASIAFVGVNGC